MRLRLQLTLVFGVFIAVILSAFAVSVYFLTERSLRAGVQERGAVAIAELTSGARTIAQGLQKLPSDTYFQILIVGQAGFAPDSPASLRAGVPYLNNYNLAASLSDPAIQTLLVSGEVSGMVDAEGGRMHIIGRLGQLEYRGQETVVEAAYFVGVPAGMMAATLDQLARDLILTVLVAFLAFALGVWILAERVLGPLKRVTAAAALVSGSELSQRVPVSTNKDEIRDLGVAINNMLGRLQESFETQRRFTADASHELRTPLNTLYVETQLRQLQLERGDQQAFSPANLRAMIDRDGHQIRSMIRLISDMVDVSRIKSGRLSIRPEAANLSQLLQRVVEGMAQQAQAAGCAIQLSIEDDVTGFWDEFRIEQVVINLLTNAFRYGCSKPVDVSLARGDEVAEICVRDHGIGIAPDAQQKIFQKFERLDSTNVREGLGMGLYIAKQLVGAHEGDIKVESVPGEGAAFRVVLPLRAQAVALEEA